MRVILKTLFVTSLLLLAPYSSGESAQAQWPSSSCTSSSSWFIFAGTTFCIEKTNLASMNVLNTDTPSVSLRANMNGKEVELALLRLDDQKVTGGLHTHFGLAAREVLEMLVQPGIQNLSPDRGDLVKDVFDVDETTHINRFVKKSIHAYALTGQTGGRSTIYVFYPDRPGALMMTGEFDRAMAEKMISMIQVN